MFYDFRPLTCIQLSRLYNRTWERMTAGDGYQPFGYDWPTVYAVHPGFADVLISLRTEAIRRLHS